MHWSHHAGRDCQGGLIAPLQLAHCSILRLEELRRFAQSQAYVSSTHLADKS